MKKTILSVLIGLSFHSQALVLTKAQLVQSVNKNFPEILAQQEKVIQATQGTFSARGAFDPAIVGKVDANPIGGYENRYVEATLQQPIENSGNRIEAGYRLGRGDWPVYYQNYLTNAYGDTFIGINVPILRDRMIDKNRLKIWQNDLLTDAEKLLLAIKQNEIKAAAIDVYWDWIRASSRLMVAKHLLDIAQVRQAAIDQQAALGDIARVNQAENRRLIMQRQSKVVRERQKYINAQNKLRFYMGGDFKRPKSDPWVPPGLTTALVKLNKAGISLTSIKKYQPYLAMMDTKIKQSQLEIKLAKNDMLPGLDVGVYLDKQHGDGSSKLGTTTFNLGLKYKFPLRVRKAEGKIAQNQAKVRDYQYQKQLFLRKLSLTYQDIMIDLKSLAEIHHFRSEEKKFAKLLEVAERKRFEAGDSSLFLVNQREQTVASTKLLIIDAMVQYQQRMNLLHSLTFYR